MASVVNITVVAVESLYRDKAKQLLRVPAGRRCGFRIFTNTKMMEVMEKLTKVIWTVPLKSVEFTFAGVPVKPNDDFLSLCMRELDVIEVSHAADFYDLPPSSLSADFRKLVGSHEGADFIFKVGKPSTTDVDMIDSDTGSSAYREIPVHKFILKARNERFRALFDSQMQESKSGSVEVPHYQPRTFLLMLEYLYTDEIQGEIQLNEYLELLALADEYVIPRLKRICELKLMQDIKGTNALEILSKASLYQAEDLKNLCTKYLRENFIELGRKDPNFLNEISKEELFEIAASAIEGRTKRQRILED